MMLRMRIAAMNAIAEDRHIGEAGFRHDEQFVHRFRKAVDRHLGGIGLRIEKQNLGSHLVDRDHAVFNACHGCVPGSCPMRPMKRDLEVACKYGGGDMAGSEPAPGPRARRGTWRETAGPDLWRTFAGAALTAWTGRRTNPLRGRGVGFDD